MMSEPLHAAVMRAVYIPIRYQQPHHVAPGVWVKCVHAKHHVQHAPATHLRLMHLAMKVAVGELANLQQAKGALSLSQVLSLQGRWC